MQLCVRRDVLYNMDYHRHDNCSPGSGHSRMETVAIPTVHAGVGDALRRAYVDPMQAQPRDFMMLLDRLR